MDDFEVGEKVRYLGDDEEYYGRIGVLIHILQTRDMGLIRFMDGRKMVSFSKDFTKI